MFNGLRSEQEAWTSCVKIILGLLEDSLLNGAVPNTKINFSEDSKDWLRNSNGSTETLSTPESPNNYHTKRKRSFSDTAQDRKLQKLSSSLANDIARSLSVSMEDDVDMTTHSFSDYSKHLDEADPVPTLRRISMSGTSKPALVSSLQQWLEMQAQKHNLPLAEFKNIFNDKQKQLRKQLEQLQSLHQSFDTLRENLSKVLRLADDLSGDHTLSFIEIFPEWVLYENRIKQLATYIQSVEDMSSSVNSVIPQTSNLLQDIKGLQNLLDSKMALYGDSLIQNGLEWRAMGLPVDDQLLNATKEWLHNLCVGLLDALDSECKKAQDLVEGMEDLIKLPIGENLMASILAGLEFIAETSTFIGFTSQKLIYDCRVLATIYGQWVSENLEHLDDKPTTENIPIITTTSYGPKKSSLSIHTNSSKRMDIRFMQLMDNITRILASLYTLSELEMRNRQILHISSSVLSVENLSAVLVELSVRAVGVLEKERASLTESVNTKVAGNIMTNPQTAFIYMGESLLSFVSKLVELANRESVDKGRIQALHSFLEELESSLETV